MVIDFNNIVTIIRVITRYLIRVLIPNKIYFIIGPTSLIRKYLDSLSPKELLY